MAETEELDERRTLLSTALEELTERERDILEARRLRDEPVTLEELSKKYGISRERVRQIEVQGVREASGQDEGGAGPQAGRDPRRTLGSALNSPLGTAKGLRCSAGRVACKN